MAELFHLINLRKRRVSLFIMQRKPHGFFIAIGPLNAMAPMRGNEDIIAGVQLGDLRFTLEE